MNMAGHSPLLPSLLWCWKMKKNSEINFQHKIGTRWSYREIGRNWEFRDSGRSRAIRYLESTGIHSIFCFQQKQTKLTAVAKDLGRDIRIFTNSAGSTSSDSSASTNAEEPDDFYDLTPEDYYHITSNKIGAQSQVLKTGKIRGAEAAARREKLTKAAIRVRFPDDYILETDFQPSEKIQSLVDLLIKVISRPDVPFYLYTTPPKERIKDMSKDFYSAGFAPGAIVYFSYDLPKDEANASLHPYLCHEILSLNDLHRIHEQAEVVNPEPEPSNVLIPSLPEAKTVLKKTTKPKWFKL